MMNLIVFCSLNFLFIYILKYDLHGFLMAFYIKCILEFAVLLYCAKTYNKIPLIKPNIKEMIDNYWKDFVFSVYILFGLFGEVLGVECNTYFAALTGKVVNIISW